MSAQREDRLAKGHTPDDEFAARDPQRDVDEFGLI